MSLQRSSSITLPSPGWQEIIRNFRRGGFGEPLYFAASDKPPNRDRILTPPQNRNQHMHPCQVRDQAIRSAASIDRDANTGRGVAFAIAALLAVAYH